MAAVPTMSLWCHQDLALLPRVGGLHGLTAYINPLGNCLQSNACLISAPIWVAEAQRPKSSEVMRCFLSPHVFEDLDALLRDPKESYQSSWVRDAVLSISFSKRSSSRILSQSSSQSWGIPSTQGPPQPQVLFFQAIGNLISKPPQRLLQWALGCG